MGSRHFLVLGAGVIGVTTSYRLAANGHRVTVVDSEDRAATMTNFANAGLLAPAPGLRLDLAIRVRPESSWRQWQWMLRFLRECTAARHAANSAVTSKLCQFSQLQMNRIVRETSIDYDARQGGLIYIYHSAAELESADTKADTLRARGIRLERRQDREMLEVDPGLIHIAGDAAGGRYAPGDESGDAHLFTTALAKKAETMGITFRFSTRVTRLVRRGAHCPCRDRQR